MSLPIEEHRHYLSDAPRLAAFAAAVGAVVRPGDVVVDLASGSGILGFLACQSGAARVYAIDSSPAIQLGRELAAANGFADRVTFVREFSTRAVLPERADVLVFDQLGPMGYDAGVFEFARDARQRLLTPAARIVPAAVDIHVAGIESPALRDGIDFWGSLANGVDLSVLRPLAVNTAYTAADESFRRLTDSALAAARKVGREDVACIDATVRLQLLTAGRLDALCGWFTAHLAPGITITNEPGAAGRINRRVAVLPLDPPVNVAPGDDLEVRLVIRPEDDQIAWQVELRRNGHTDAAFRHSSFQGLLVSDESRAAGDPEWRPRLTPFGEAHRTVLSCCDGSVPLAAIVQTVREQHAAIMRNHAEAAAFVHGVVNASCR